MDEVTPERLARLTRDQVKGATYERETYFRDGLGDVDRIAGAGAKSFHEDIALLILKPDGLRHGVTSTVLSVLADWGYEVAWADVVPLDRHVWRELWRYQLNVATRRRLDFNDYLFSRPGVSLVLRRDGQRAVPAAVELASRKGSATIELQASDCLRAHLGQPHRVLSLIHVADEPLDVVRELGILLDRTRRVDAIAAAMSGHSVSPQQMSLLAASALGPEPGRGLADASTAERRVREALAVGTDGASTELRVLVDGARASDGLDWALAGPLLDRADAPVDRWDLIAASAAWLKPDDPRYSKTLGSVDFSSWAA